MVGFRNFIMAALILALVFVFASPVLAQTGNDGFAYPPIWRAAAYAYGLRNGLPQLTVDTGNTAIGAATITLAMGPTQLVPWGYVPAGSTTRTVITPILIGVGTNQETVSPTSVSCNTPGIHGTCTITATFTKTHGRGDPVRSGTCGLQEAVNLAHARGGGLVVIDAAFIKMGCTTTTVTANDGWTDVTVLDWTGTTGAKSYTASANHGDHTVTAISLY